MMFKCGCRCCGNSIYDYDNSYCLNKQVCRICYSKIKKICLNTFKGSKSYKGSLKYRKLLPDDWLNWFDEGTKILIKRYDYGMKKNINYNPDPKRCFWVRRIEDDCYQIVAINEPVFNKFILPLLKTLKLDSNRVDLCGLNFIYDSIGLVGKNVCFEGVDK